MKEDNISQLGDYDAPFWEQQYTHGSCYFSLFKFKAFDQFNTPQTASNFRHLFSCGTVDILTFSRGRVVTKGRQILIFVKSKPPFDVHRQYLDVSLIDL